VVANLLKHVIATYISLIRSSTDLYSFTQYGYELRVMELVFNFDVPSSVYHIFYLA